MYFYVYVLFTCFFSVFVLCICVLHFVGICYVGVYVICSITLFKQVLFLRNLFCIVSVLLLYLFMYCLSVFICLYSLTEFLKEGICSIFFKCVLYVTFPVLFFLNVIALQVFMYVCQFFFSSLSLYIFVYVCFYVLMFCILSVFVYVGCSVFCSVFFCLSSVLIYFMYLLLYSFLQFLFCFVNELFSCNESVRFNTSRFFCSFLFDCIIYLFIRLFFMYELVRYHFPYLFSVVFQCL